MTRMPEYSTSVELDPGQRDVNLLMGHCWEVMTDYSMLSRLISRSQPRAMTETTLTRWPDTGAPDLGILGQMRLPIEGLVLRASSSIWRSPSHDVGEPETERPARRDDLSTESAVSAPVGFPHLATEHERARQMLVAAFAQIGQVTAIYAQAYREEIQVTVLLGVAAYDDELMEQLLDREYEVQKAVLSPVLSFSYIPKVYVNRRDIVHPGARLIYER